MLHTTPLLLFAALIASVIAGCADTLEITTPIDASTPDATSADTPTADTSQQDEDTPHTTDTAPTDPAPTGPTPDATPDAPDAPPDASQPHPTRDPLNQTHSPITSSVAASLRSIAAQAPDMNDHAFAKVGDSITVSPHFLTCFAGPQVDLGEHDALAPTLDHFLGGWADGATPFDRESFTATGGWPAFRALDGDPSPLERELTAISPRFAVVMFGTNDIGWDNIDRYADNMLTIADTLISHGVIPLMMTIPPREDTRVDGALQVPRYNAVIRAVAQARQVPLIDYHRELLPLPERGLGSDGVHPNVYRDGGGRGCILTPTGLQHGYNVRNLLTLAGLHRARSVVVEDNDAPDPPGEPLQGDGSPDNPFLIDSLPFSDLRDTTTSPHRNLNRYTGCDADQDESGPEFTYRLSLTRRTTLRAMVLDRGDVDIDVHLMTGTSAESCLERAHTAFTVTLNPGDYTFVLDTWVGSAERAGEYLFVLHEE